MKPEPLKHDPLQQSINKEHYLAGGIKTSRDQKENDNS
jgi:hypothetical protein